MASLSYVDLLKRDNIEVLLERIDSRSTMILGARDDGEVINLSGAIELNNIRHENLSPEELREFLTKRTSTDSIQIETSDQRMIRVTKFFKDKSFGGVPGKSSGAGSERQEEGVIDAIVGCLERSNNIANDHSPLPITVTTLNYPRMDLEYPKPIFIVNASKNEGLSSIGKEPYIDVNLVSNKGEVIGCSMKGMSAPSLAGGGLAGINTVTPHLMPRLYTSVTNHLVSEGYHHGDIVDNKELPDLYLPVPLTDTRILIEGTKEMGGPVQFMYVGPMDVTYTFQRDFGQYNVDLNGNFYSVEEYMQKIPEFYFRVRKRDLDVDNRVQIDYYNLNKEGFPKLFTSPTTGKNNLRIVVVDKVPKTGKKLPL